MLSFHGRYYCHFTVDIVIISRWLLLSFHGRYCCHFTVDIVVISQSILSFYDGDSFHNGYCCHFMVDIFVISWWNLLLMQVGCGFYVMLDFDLSMLDVSLFMSDVVLFRVGRCLSMLDVIVDS